MTVANILTTRDEELLQALVIKVRLFLLRQIAKHWWQGDIANARRRLKQLAAADLVRPIAVLARPLPPLINPIVTWRPGEPAPDFGQIAFRLQRRWRPRPLRSYTAYLATPHTAQLFGRHVCGKVRQPTQLTHDVGVAEVWLRYRSSQPEVAALWLNEDSLSYTRKHEKCPDAFLMKSDGSITAVIEFGGDYHAAHVRAHHEDCQRRGLPYFLW